MKFKNLFTVSGLLRVLLLLSFGLQMIVASQMYFFNNEFFDEPFLYFMRLLEIAILTFIGSAAFVYPLVILIRYLNQNFPWKSNRLKRLLIQIVIVFPVGLLLTMIILIPACFFLDLEINLTSFLYIFFYIMVPALILMYFLEAVTSTSDSKDDPYMPEGYKTYDKIRKEAELSPDESEKRYKDLMDFLPQPVFELNLQGELVLSNKAGDEFFGPIPDKPGEKLSALDCFVKEDIPRIIENFKKSAMGIETEPGEFTAIKKDGTLCPVMVFGSPIIQNSKITGRRGIIIDISERKNYEVNLLNAKNELEKINNNLEQIVSVRTKELTEINTKLLKVQKENLQSQFEILKSQINPHFMFNSLNVLSGLINTDVSKAQLFIDEFSQIYRYVLETIEQQVVTLSKELDFMRSYLFLQQIRYGESLTYSVNIIGEYLRYFVPPLSLQVLLENAMKHNIVNEEKPLKIEVYTEGEFLYIKNPVQPKISGTSTGLGLKNLMQRYALISNLKPEFKLENNYYIAKIPLIKADQDEHTDN